MIHDWRQISRAMQDEDVVFVVGVPRGGTTALRATFDRHPSFRAREVDSVETQIFASPESADAVLDDAGTRLREFLLDDEAAARELHATIARLAAEGGGDVDRVRVFFHFARRARGVARLLEKTPRHLDHLDEIAAAFPRSKVLICVRHPVDVYSSYRKKLFKAERRSGVQDKHGWLQLSPERFAEKYAGWIDTMLEHERAAPERCRVVRYERLTQQPREVIRELCEFLGEPFDEPTLFDEVQVERDEFGSPRPRQRIVVNEKDWREFLSDEDARTVETRTADRMARLAYARYT